MDDDFSRLPAPAAERVARFVHRVDALQPGTVTAIWVAGSIALGDYRPGISDVDLVVVTKGTLAERERRRLQPWSWPPLQIGWNTLDDIWRLAERDHGCGAVTVATLHRHGIRVRGPEPADELPDVDHATLIRAMSRNLVAYWRPWLERVRGSALERLAALHPRRIEWGVLGVPRQLITVREGRVVSKTAAGRYARAQMDSRWHRIVDEALRLRAGERRSLYRSLSDRRSEMVAFLDEAIRQTLGEVAAAG